MSDFEGGSDRRSKLGIFDCTKDSVKISWGICSVSSVITIIVLIAVSLKKLTSVEYGVEYDRWTKTLDDAAKTGGLHVGPPGYGFVKFPSTQITASLTDTCVSRDGLRVEFEVTFQYQMPADAIVKAVNSYRDYKTWVLVVEAAGNSAVQHTCSEFNVTDFQTQRIQIQSSMHDSLRMKLQGSPSGITDDGVYAFASSLQLKNVELPWEYKNAIAGKQQAEEDIALAKNQRTQETTKAQTEQLAADEEARKIMDKAYNDGNVTIIEAELKAQETLFAFVKEQEVLSQAKSLFSLDANGVLAYMSNQLYASTPFLEASLGEPARISRKDELEVL
jgi:regulator of protease activity HflC (stomatin/prohibitin superfamily)